MQYQTFDNSLPPVQSYNDNIMAIFRYRYSTGTLPVQTFAAIKFSETDNSVPTG
jgi:ABC-type spermidine/putrescine transport system permease subunit II